MAQENSSCKEKGCRATHAVFSLFVSEVRETCAQPSSRDGFFDDAIKTALIKIQMGRYHIIYSRISCLSTVYGTTMIPLTVTTALTPPATPLPLGCFLSLFFFQLSFEFNIFLCG